jgi:hypothetical protein
MGPIRAEFWLKAAPLTSWSRRHCRKTGRASGVGPIPRASLEGRSSDRADRTHLRGWSRRFLARALAAVSRHRSMGDTSDEHRRVARPPAAEDGSARHADADARVPGQPSRPLSRRMPSARRESTRPSSASVPASSTARSRRSSAWTSAASNPTCTRRRNAWRPCARRRACPFRRTLRGTTWFLRFEPTL